MKNLYQRRLFLKFGDTLEGVYPDWSNHSQTIQQMAYAHAQTLAPNNTEAVRKKNKNAAYADTMRKIVRDGLEANE